jgi:hypothetical protein
MNRSAGKSRTKGESPELTALRRAARQALELARRTGTPCHVMEKGKIIDIASPKRRGPARRMQKRT